ncbi:MAG: cell division protein FtsZ, partial [Euryhalocaulis sp.]|nr:cell division protein FtsZ [Euryhalocaulis sp.]
GFSLFGLRKPAEQDSREKPEQEQQPQQTQRPNVRVASGDLFNGMDDDDLEIPAFLRRQAN